jgi:hypothetical protein
MSLHSGTTASIESAGLEAAKLRLDRATSAYLQCVAPIRFRAATSDAERFASFRMRYEAIIDQGWAMPEAFPDGLERDNLDDEAVHVVGWLGDRAVASSRLIFPQPGSLLPVEEDFGVQVDPAGGVVEMDRSCVGRGSGAWQEQLFVAVLCACWLEIRRAGFAVTTGRISHGVLRLYRLLGIEHEILGPAQVSWQEKRLPVRFTAECVGERFYERLERLCG